MKHLPPQAFTQGRLATLVTLFLLAFLPKGLAQDTPAIAPEGPGTGFEALSESAPIGSGDGRIHVIPSLHPYSVKNGETLTVTAVVRSERPISSVTANLGGLATITLQPDVRLGGVSADGTTGIYTAQWTGVGLEEKVYAATLTITDATGHSWTDHSLTFSDPAAGNSTPGSAAYLMNRIGRADLEFAEEYLPSAVIDTVNGYAYFGTGTNPGRVVKVSLGGGSNLPMRVGAVTLDSGENFLLSAVIDTAGGHAYFVTSNAPGSVVKVALGSGSNPPVRVGAVTFESGENTPYVVGVIDPGSGYAYFGTGTNPGRVVKVALGSGSNPPTRVGAVTLNSGESTLKSAVIDTVGGHAYFGTETSPGVVVKVALGSGDNPPTRVGAVTLFPGESYLVSAVIDPASGHAYFGTETTIGRVIKVALGSGSNPPTRVGAVTLNSGEMNLISAVIDTSNGHAYFGLGSFLGGRVVKVALGSGSNPPTRVGAITLESGEDYLPSAVIDTTSGIAYFGTETSPGGILTVAYSQRGQLKGTRFTMPEAGAVTDARFHSHVASGNVRLALYDDAEPKNLLWQSGAVANTAADADLIVPISSGAPASLFLPAGTYWAAWQVDSTADVPSLTAGTAGDGFKFAQAFGAAPATLEAPEITTTDERWTVYITYELDTTPPTSSASADAIQVGGAITGTYSANDSGSGVASVDLYVREPGGAWTNAGAVTGGTWSYTPTQTGDAADGLYEFATVATDNASNSETAPTGGDLGDVAVLYNDATNSAFTVTLNADGTAQFPMTATEVIEIVLAGVTGPVTITVSRTMGDVAPAGFMAGRLIDELLSITGNLAGASATITWNHAPASLDPPGFTATLNTVFQLSGATQTGQYAVTPSGNTLVIGPVTSFSDWYAGSNDATVADWTLLAE